MDDKTFQQMTRKRKKDTKESRLCLRLTNEDEKKLAYIMWKTGMSKSEIIRKGINTQYTIAQYAD